MIFDLPNTTTSAISRKIEELHEERGEAAQSRVLTLLVETYTEELENSLETANAASREHPCRVIVIVKHARPADAAEGSTLDAQIRFGADAGAGEIIVLKPADELIRHLDTLVIPLLVPDAPVVAWWPTKAPENPSVNAIGRMARSRITDALRAPNPEAAFIALRAHFTPQDVDMSWTRLTIWRALLVSMLDQPPHLPITSVKLTGPTHDLPLELLASWIAWSMPNVPITVERSDDLTAISGVYFTRADGVLSIERAAEDTAVISQPGQSPQNVTVPIRTLGDCLSEELRRLDPDEIYAEVIEHGWGLIEHE